MARRRGFFAELQYQNQLAAKQQAQAERAQARAHAAAVREAERAQREAERAAAAASRASAAEQKAAEREAKRLHEEARLAEVDALNTQLAEITDELDSILSATLDVDDFVDLDDAAVLAQPSAISPSRSRGTDARGRARCPLRRSRCSSSPKRQRVSAVCSAARRSTRPRWQARAAVRRRAPALAS